MSTQPSPAQEEEFLLDKIVQRDMSGVYKQFGGLGTAAGRKMYALYNKEESASKRAQYRIEIATKKPQTSPQELHDAKVRQRYEQEKQKKSYIAPLPPIHRPTRAFAPVHFIPHRRSQHHIARQLRKDFPEYYEGAAPARTVTTIDREQEKQRLQTLMEHGGSRATVGVRVDKTKLQQQPRQRVVAGKVIGRRTRSEQEQQLFDQIMCEITEREDFLRQMRDIYGPDYYERKIDVEIKDRLAQLQRLEKLMDEDE